MQRGVLVQSVATVVFAEQQKMGIFSESFMEVLLELLTHKGVDDWIEAAVYKGECLSQLHG